jgi:hypothetical protein
MPTEPVNAEPPKRDRHWSQFSLRLMGYVGWRKMHLERRTFSNA